MGILANENAISSGGYQISNSLRFQSASSQYLSRTPASAGNRQTWTWSGWVKRGTLGADQQLMCAGTANIGVFGFLAADTFFFNFEYTSNAYVTTQVFRDPSAWYHIVVVADSTNATASNRTRLYVNGTQVTAFSSTSYPAQNNLGYININQLHTIGRRSDVSSAYFDGYMTEINFVDGQALTPSSFGETDTLTGQWVAKKYTGTYGTNGFYLPFSNGTSTTTLGSDSSGNGNNWTLNNFTRSAGVSDCWMYDVPSGNGGVAGTQPNSNYAVLNPLSNAVAPVNANLRMSASTGNYSGLASMTMPSGKWYWECVNTGGSVFPMFGIARASLAANVGFWTSSLGYAYYYDGTKYNASTPTSYGASYTANDIIGVAFDADAGTLTFYKNNVSQGVAFTGLTQGDYCPAIGQGSGVLVTNNVNFGQRSFAYTPPSGFKALCTANLPASTIVKGNQYMDATLWSGDGNSTRTISNSALFAPDFVWLKNRSDTTSHLLYDVIRGVSNGTTSKALQSNSTTAEGSVNDNSTYGYLNAFNSNGFSVTKGSDPTTSYTNKSGNNYVAWQWNAGGSTVTNTSGSISSQVRANTTAGFSIVTYTGTGANATVGHGLGVAPKMIIIKNRTLGTSNWMVYHANANASPASGNLYLSATNAFTTAADAWNNTAPTSSVFSLGTSTWLNANTNNMVAYCFAEIAGFSKFGSYTGNGSADNVFVYCGFKPRFIMTKRTDSTGSWYMFDTARNTYNVLGEELIANTSAAGVTATDLDILSNGFKWRAAISGTWIFMAFAENPFAQANAF